MAIQNNLSKNNIRKIESDEELRAYIEDYKIHNHDLRLRASQYERLWMMLISVLGGLIAWGFQYNLSDSEPKSLLAPNGIFAVIPLMILVWFLFISYVSSVNRLLNIYLFKLEKSIQGYLNITNGSRKIPFGFRLRYKDLIQDATKFELTSFSLVYVALTAIIFLLLIWSSYLSISFFEDNGKSGLTIGLVIGGLFILSLWLFYDLQRKIMAHEN